MGHTRREKEKGGKREETTLPSLFLALSFAKERPFPSKGGQFLIEALVAMGVLTVGFLAVLGLLNRSIALARTVTDSYTASYLAAEGVEIVKSLIDRNDPRTFCTFCSPWGSNFVSRTYTRLDYSIDDPSRGHDLDCSSLEGCTLLFDETKGYNFTSGKETRFKRVITVNRYDTGRPGEPISALKVVSKVTWTAQGGDVSEIVLEDYFYNWRP